MKIERKWGETYQEMLQRYYDEAKYFYPTDEKKEPMNTNIDKNEEETEEYYSNDDSVDDRNNRILEDDLRTFVTGYQPSAASTLFRNMLAKRSASDKMERARRGITVIDWMIPMMFGNYQARPRPERFC